MLVVEVLVTELSTIDGFSTSTISMGEIATLSHETWDNAMEFGAFIVEWLA